MGAPSCGHQALQVVRGCGENAVQPLRSPWEAPDDVLDVPELQGAPVSAATQELLRQVARSGR